MNYASSALTVLKTRKGLRRCKRCMRHDVGSPYAGIVWEQWYGTEKMRLLRREHHAALRAIRLGEHL